MARKLKCHAEFRSFDQMLIIAFVMSFFGFILAAPGAVFISGNMNVKKNGTISLAGPLVNLIIALIILPFLLVYTSKILTYVFMINAWFGLFNLIPIGNFDGRKILRWNKPIYVIMVLVALSLMFAQSFLA